MSAPKIPGKNVKFCSNNNNYCPPLQKKLQPAINNAPKKIIYQCSNLRLSDDDVIPK